MRLVQTLADLIGFYVLKSFRDNALGVSPGCCCAAAGARICLPGRDLEQQWRWQLE